MAYLKPLPEITELNRPFWDALKRHEFTVPRCADCGDYNWVPYPACRSCLSERQAWTLEARLSHVSNAGTATPNLGLNGLVFLAGWRF